MTEILKKKEVDGLFDIFSYPLVKSAITEHQQKVAMGLVRLLWLPLVTGLDTEQQIYETLKMVFKKNHEKIVAVGSLYFFKMKTSLSTLEIDRLKEYYAISENINALKDWIKHS